MSILGFSWPISVHTTQAEAALEAADHDRHRERGQIPPEETFFGGGRGGGRNNQNQMGSRGSQTVLVQGVVGVLHCLWQSSYFITTLTDCLGLPLPGGTPGCAISGGALYWCLGGIGVGGALRPVCDVYTEMS